MAKKTDLKDQSIDELKAKASELDREVFELRNELALNRKIEKPHLIRAKKKTALMENNTTEPLSAILKAEALGIRTAIRLSKRSSLQIRVTGL